MSLTGNATAEKVLRGRINRLDTLCLSAYAIAVKNGFEGTEEEWLESLKVNSNQVEEYVTKYLEENPVAIDETLSISGQAADAKKTGEAIAAARKASEDSVNDHASNKNNPHGVTAIQVGARPNTWMPTADDVGARPDTWMPTASQVGARPSNWTPTAKEVGAVTEEEVSAMIQAQVPTMINDALGVIENATY